MKNKNVLLILALILIVGLILIIEKPLGAKDVTSQKTTNLKIGDAAPDFTLLDTTDKNVALSDFKGKKAVIVNFWASWCYACISEMPMLQQASQNYKDNLVVLGINRQESKKDAIKFAYSIGVSFPLLLDTDRKINDLYGVTGLPVTYFINKDGIITGLKRGELIKEEVDNNIQKMI